MMYGDGKSDSSIVPVKSANNDERGVFVSSAEQVEERGLAKGNVVQQNVRRTQSRESMSSALGRVREIARNDKEVRFTALMHHISVDRLLLAFLSLKKNAAAGVDGVKWHEYEANARENIVALHTRLHQGAYRAKPIRRVYIAKADGRQRSLGVSVLEDKIVQRATCEVLNAIYEEDFLGFSYGSRPGRNAHRALDALAVSLTKKVSWVLDADIRGFFDAINHEWMVKFLEHRIGDKRMLHRIQKWLRAEVMEDRVTETTELGTPQGATISPLLANVYLHYVFDLWIQQWRKRHSHGEVYVVRYVDDVVVGFQYERDARSFLSDLKSRFQTFGLELHPDKTRLIEFGGFARERREKRGLGKPETFDVLGFTHMCGISRKGQHILRRHTIKSRMRAKLQEVKFLLMKHRHNSITEQGSWLRSVVQGHFAYYAVPNNGFAIQAFRTEINRYWLHALRRRSQRHRLSWERMQGLIRRWIPSPRIQHPWPSVRFAAITQGRSPVR